MKHRLKVLFVTMDPLETNTSANIRNRGLLLGLVSLGHSVDTLSMEPDSASIAFDRSLSIAEQINERYYFKPNALYKKMRARRSVQAMGNTCSKRSVLSAGKMKLRHFVRVVLSNTSAYDLQRFNARNVKTIKMDYQKYDVIISSSDPKSAHLIVKHLIKKANKRSVWIQYWGDPFLGDITGNQSRWGRYLRKKAENRLLKKADSVVYTSVFTLNMQRYLYPQQKEKMIYAVQAAVCQEKKQKWKAGEKLTLGYFGNYHSGVRDIRPLFTAVADRDVNLVVCGDGDIDTDNRNITLYSRVSYEKSMELEKKMDILICVCNQSGTQIPGKIYYAAGYQKPIILILDGEAKQQMRKFFEKFHRYILCDNCSTAIIEAIGQAESEMKEGREYQIPEEMHPEYVAKMVLNTIQREA